MQAPSLPPTRQWGRAAQLRIVAFVAVGVMAVMLLISVVHTMLSSPPAPEPALPAGAFRPTAEQLQQLTIAPVAVGANAELVRATGSIAADADHSTPVLLPFSGQVLNVFVEPGQYVRVGQPLLRIASPELVDARNALASASAQVTSAAEAVQLASANTQRQREIYLTAGGAQKDFIQSQNDLVVAQSALRTAQSAAQAARDHLALFGKSPGDASDSAQSTRGQPATLYRAPVAGLIADRNVAPGQFLTAGGSTALLTITDPSHVWLVAQLDESDAALVRIGDRVTVTTPALPGRSFIATIDNVGASLDPATHRLPVRATVANPDGVLKPQMFASFAITRPLSGGGGVLVPTAAVIHEGDDARVWVLKPDHLLYARTVRTADSEGGLTRVTAGLSPGDRIVTAGALFVNEAGTGE